MRIANPNPHLCSACFEQKPEELHIDFEAAYDGPVIDAESGIKVTVDDLFICASCLISAYQLLDPESEHATIHRLVGDLEKAIDRGVFLQSELQKIRDILKDTEPVEVFSDE